MRLGHWLNACNPNLTLVDYLCQLEPEIIAKTNRQETLKLLVALTACFAFLFSAEGRGNGTFTHLVELDPLFIPLGARVWHPESAKLCSEEVG